MRRAVLVLAIASTLVASAGCATRASAPEETGKLAARYARYAEYAGPPIRQFTWLGQFYSWEALGKDKLVVFTTPSDAYLLTVWPNCDMRWVSLRHDEAIGVTFTGGTVSSGLDSVIEDSPGLGRQRCPISEIRKVDYRRMMADKRATAPASKAANGTSTGNQ